MNDACALFEEKVIEVINQDEVPVAVVIAVLNTIIQTQINSLVEDSE